MYFGALEAGGTKMVLAIMDENGNETERESIPTRTPDETMPEMIRFFSEVPIAALGIGGFGPLNLDKKSAAYGSIMETPKLAWRHYPLMKTFEDALHVPVGIDTDVNAAALAEARLGAARGLESCLYVTVGTGIGGGVIANGRPVHGMMHPEIGHIMVTPDPADPMPNGVCPYHPHCLEGLAAGPSMEKRWGISAKELPHDHKAWDIESTYLAQLCAYAILALSPEKIILGGGVMQQKFLLPLIRQKTVKLLNGYIAHPNFEDGLETYIVEPGLGTRSGITGAYLLAREAYTEAGK
ncbi:MAG: ROK family protein [Clostridia bacterium]|nr:ROK family protein [Clostridia bacterium]